MTALRLLAPVSVLCGFAFLQFGVDAFFKEVTPGVRRASFWLTLLGTVIAAALLVPPSSVHLFGREMLIWDGLAYFFSWIVLLTLLFIVLLSEHYKDFSRERMSAFYGLLLLSAVGLIFLISANDFLMVFLAIELFGIPSFILVGYLRFQERSSEAAIKLFLIGAFSTAMLIYGISILYGVTGSSSLTQLHDRFARLSSMGPLAIISLFFVIVSFGFKMAFAPFHMWVPDVFEGAPKPVAALLSVAPKIAGAAITLRVFSILLPYPELGCLVVLAALAALTMTLGNVVGLQQTNVIRLLAYSSIAHMGYLMLGIVGGGEYGITGVYLYGWIYLFMNLGAFAVVISLSSALGSDDLSAYAGLSKRSPLMAGLMTLFLVSLAGIPPTAGFIAKFYVFLAAFHSGWIWLVALGAINSVISVGYYFRIIHWMYFKPPESNQPLAISMPERLTLAATSFFSLFLGVSPQFFVATAKALSIVPKP